jgi:hypothetical protein
MPVEVFRYSNGPLRGVLKANEAWLALMMPRERNALLRSAGKRAANEWRFRYVPLRFTSAVLGAPWFYDYPSQTPMIYKGTMIRQVFTGQINVTAKTDAGGTQQVKSEVSLPFGHGVIPEIARVWRIIPPNEVQFFAERFAFHAIAEQRQLVTNVPRGQSRLRLRLAAGQRRRLGVTKHRGVGRRAGAAPGSGGRSSNPKSA